MSQKLLNFKIDPALDKLWNAMGYSQVEKAEESKKLETCLLRAYQNFIAEATSSCDDLRSELRDALMDFQHVQLIFGDDSPQPNLNPRSSLRDQVDLVYEMTDELKIKYEPIVQKFDEIYETLQEQFNLLRIDEENQGEFVQVGSEDMTADRLQRFQQMSKNLEAEIEQRTKVFDSISRDLEAVLNDVQEFPRDDVQEALNQKYIDNESLALMKDALKTYQQMKETNQNQIDEQWEKLVHLYLVLNIQEDDQMQRPTNPSVEAVDSLKNEIINLQQQADVRVPVYAKQLNREIRALSNEIRLPKKLRPKYTGTDQEEEVIFLTKELQKLKQTQIKSQPIIEIISEIETLKGSLASTDIAKLTSRERGSTKRLAEDEKNRKIAKEQMPKLEQQLLKLLVEFKNENGYDFEFEGIDITQIGVKEENNEVIQPKQSLGKALLLQKLGTAASKPEKAKSSEPPFMKTAGNRTSRMSSSTRKKPFY